MHCSTREAWPGGHDPSQVLSQIGKRIGLYPIQIIKADREDQRAIVTWVDIFSWDLVRPTRSPGTTKTMKPSLLPLLACPRCRSQLALGAQTKRDGHIEEGTLSCTGCGAGYPISGSIPRFVPRQNYAEGFGFQWNRFRRTQLDSHSGLTISHDRLLRQTGWPQESFRDARVLDIGCGAGRFAEVALGLGAEVFAVDYSTAVDATLENLGNHPRLNVVQGDLYHLPFAANSFDMLYCFGVIQHTPDPYRAVLSLPALLTGGGYLAVDVYPRRWTNALLFRYWLRPITTRMPQDRLFRIVQRATPFLLSVSRAIGRIPSVGRYLRRLV